jgi:allophanate hydrolase subunit 2
MRIGSAPESFDSPPPAPDPRAAIRIVPGPDLDRFESDAFERLLVSVFHVAVQSDRVGTRLLGPPLSRADADVGASAPMVEGAIQVPASGEPIVLGPDHPTTGGYPVIATVVRRDLGALMAKAIGSIVRFELP